jgi:hypothetical protein
MLQGPAGVQIVPLVPNVATPRRAPARVRQSVPPGYGVQEQCLPFTAATALGLVIPSPITFGHGPAAEVPPDCRAFRGPLRLAAPREHWVFYVKDDEQCRFSGNAYRIEQEGAPATVEPGLSFFDRDDQQDVFKLHLPYVWRTAPEVDTLFLPTINRLASSIEVIAGLVETDWYANPVNLVLRVRESSIHVRAGDDLAQAVLIAREHRTPEIDVAASHSRATRETFKGWREWQRHHAQDRSAYKALARSRHGRVD